MDSDEYTKYIEDYLRAHLDGKVVSDKLIDDLYNKLSGDIEMDGGDDE